MLRGRASLLELSERPLRRTAQVFHREVAHFRAVVSYVIGQDGLGVLFPDEPHCRNALTDADNALKICEESPVQAIIFQELYVSTIVDTTTVLISIAARRVQNPDPVLQYLEENIPQDFPPFIFARRDLEIALSSENDDMLLRELRQEVVDLDQAALHRQLDEITAYRFRRPMMQRDDDLLRRIEQFRQNLRRNRQLVAYPVDTWTIAQREIKSAASLRDFAEAYNNRVNIGRFPALYRTESGSFEIWAERLKRNPLDSEARNLLSHLQMMRLFYFELYRAHERKIFGIEEFHRICDTWISNGLVLCIKADRAYTLITKQMDWFGPASRSQNGNQSHATIHPIYQWYINDFIENSDPFKQLLDHQVSPVVDPDEQHPIHAEARVLP